LRFAPRARLLALITSLISYTAFICCFGLGRIVDACPTYGWRCYVWLFVRVRVIRKRRFLCCSAWSANDTQTTTFGTITIHHTAFSLFFIGA
jgi:hypothetical protein